MKLRDETIIKNVRECIELQREINTPKSKSLMYFKTKKREKLSKKKLREECNQLKNRNEYLEQLIE